jgi:hypothetical protein
MNLARPDSIAVAPAILKESPMRKFVSVAGLATFLCLAVSSGFAGAPTASKTGPATIVIIFKDGHRQSFNLADISRVEFPNSADAAASEPAGSALPRHMLGKWEVGDGGGNNFFITLYDNGDAKRSLGDVRGKWVYVDGEAQVTWDDGAQDAIRKVGAGFQKRAFSSSKTFADSPDNVTAAHNTTPHPI